MKYLGFLFFVFILSGCTVQQELRNPLLVVPEIRTVWPAEPNVARFEYVTTLIGEKNFVVPKAERKDKGNFISNFVEFLVGEPVYQELERPIDGMIDNQGRLLVVDASHQGVVVFDMKNLKFDIWKRVSSNSKFSMPVAITGDGKGGFFVTDSERAEVIHLDANGEPVFSFGLNILFRPTGIAYDQQRDRLFVADARAHDIKIFNAEGGYIRSIGQKGGGELEFNTPTHLDFADDLLHVSDTLNFRVQSIDVDKRKSVSFGRVGNKVGNLNRPKGVAVSNTGLVYVVESFYDHLLIFNKSGRFLLPIGGTGTGLGQFYLPNGVWIDKERNVYVADMFNGRIVVLKELTTGDE